MGERKVWTTEEDEALKQILVQKKIKKWKDIAAAMETKYNMPGRSGKQCRQRWHNQLNPNISSDPWSEEEQKKLFDLHDQYGNKWAQIAKGLPGRTDNCIKNHFYSTLRKAVRKLNRFIAETRNRGDMKQIKNMVLSKIIIVSGERWDKKIPIAAELSQRCVSIKQRLIYFAKEHEVQQNEDEKMRVLVNDIMQFHKLYKRRKTKKNTKYIQKKVEPSAESIEEESASDGQAEDAPEQMNLQIRPSGKDVPEEYLKTPSHNMMPILVNRPSSLLTETRFDRIVSRDPDDILLQATMSTSMPPQELNNARMQTTKQLFGNSVDQFLSIPSFYKKPSQPNFEYMFSTANGQQYNPQNGCVTFDYPSPESVKRIKKQQ